MAAHLVMFYIIPEKKGAVESQFNHVWSNGKVTDLNVSFYLLNGKFFERGVEIPPISRSFDVRFKQYVSGVLTSAMAEAVIKD